MIEKVVANFPSRSSHYARNAKTATTRNDWGAIANEGGAFHEAKYREDLKSSIGMERRLLCLGVDLRFSTGQEPNGRRMWRGSRRAGHDHSRRYDDGNPERSHPTDARCGRANRSLKTTI